MKVQEKIARWNTLFILFIRRDWKKVAIWIIALGLFAAAFVPAFEELAKEEGLIGMYETLQNPAMTAMVGSTPVESAHDYTLGAMYSHEMLLFCCLFAMIISVLHMVSHTRKEEDLGVTELIRSFQIGRQANSFAAMVEIMMINIILAVFIGGVMICFGADTITGEGAFLFGLSIGIAGILGAALALLMAQIMPVSSAATGSSLAIIGLLYIARAGTDVSNPELSMMNPLAWTYLTYPFTENNWFPLLYALIFSLVIVVIAFTLEGARDMGAGYLPEKEGRATAKNSLLSVRGLFLKRNKGVIISWFIGLVVMGAAYGSIYGDMQAFLESNEIIEQMFKEAGATIEESFTGTIMVVLIALVSILPIVIINKLFTEENRQFLSQLYTTKLTRRKLYWTNVALAIISGMIGVLLIAISLGGTAITVIEGDSTLSLSNYLAIGLNLFPVVLFFTSLVALALGWAPKLGKVVYIYLAYSFLLSYFSGLLDLPKWLLNTAIQNWIPEMPMEDFNLTIFMSITIISIALMVFGYLGYNRRDMLEGV